jgi:membrane fusion protein, copper/silver efflux system
LWKEDLFMKYWRVMAALTGALVLGGNVACHAEDMPSPISTAEAHVHPDAAAFGPNSSSGVGRKILYYRNPMGLADISHEPKQDSMGMDYIPVYEGEEPNDSGTVTLSPQRIQRAGVRSEVVEARKLVNPIHAPGTVKYDERRLTSVAVSAEGYVDEVLVETVGQQVRSGQPLFRIYSPNYQMLQVEIARRTRGQQVAQTKSDPGLQGFLTGSSTPTALDWPSPSAGTVVEKRVIPGQRVGMGEELFRIADLSRMWVVADVSETELPAIKQGERASIKLRAYPNKPLEGKVLFIYPDLRPETRTARICIETPNPDGLMKAEMYADVTFHPEAESKPVASIPDSAVIDSGSRQVVFVDLGDGRFEPRTVKLGERGDGYVQALSGVKEGETVVTSANFLIDSESNLKAALASFAGAETKPEMNHGAMREAAQ